MLLLRFIIAIIFIFSGFMKAVDLLGFSFKIKEYFSPTVLNIPFLEKFALLFYIMVVILKISLGMMLLVKLKLKSTLSILIAICIFFGCLTFYSACFNIVKDCRCFGDTIKFTLLQSFFKNIILLVGLILLFLLYRKEFRKHKKDKYGTSENKSSRILKYMVLTIFSFGILYTMAQGIIHEPIIDFRDYKIGTDMKDEKVKIEKNPSEYKIFYSLKNEKTGKTVRVNQDDYIKKTEYWTENSPWKIEDGKNESVLIKEGYKSKIIKFKTEDSIGTEVTNEIINALKATLVFSYYPKDISANLIQKVEAKVNTQKESLIYGISTEPNTFKTIKNVLMDGAVIKAIARSNPSVLIH